MRFETKIFGPLNQLQFIVLGLSMVIIYFLYQHLDLKISLLISILIGALALYYAFSQKYDSFTEENLKKHKQQIGPEKFEKFTKMRIAELQSQISVRELKGLVSDPKLQEAKKMLEDVRDSS